MKKIKIIKIPAKQKHTIRKTIYFCDICGKQTSSIRKCVICERDICWSNCIKNCTRYEPYSGDYPDNYCPICYDLAFVKYNKEIKQIEKEADNKKEAIIERIKKESLARKKGGK